VSNTVLGILRVAKGGLRVGFLVFLFVVILTIAAGMACWHLWCIAERAEASREATEAKFAGVTDARKERERILAETTLERERTLRATHHELATLTANLAQLRTEANAAEARASAAQENYNRLYDESTLPAFGVYKPQYDFGDSDQYRRALEDIRAKQAAMLKAKQAATIQEKLSGEMLGQAKALIRLMVRAFNGEADAAIAKVRFDNVEVMKVRIKRSFEIINAFGNRFSCAISREYYRLKVSELLLVHEHREQLQEEREEQRRIREQLRDEAIARREMEEAQERAEKEEQRYEEMLAAAREAAAHAAESERVKAQAKIEELERRVAEAQANKERAISRAQQTRSGHVYIISNIGSFGEHVYKIGMTRRLDPMERVWELSDASVPFDFDVHAIIYSDDAPTLETAFHKAFHGFRINRVNHRREFFRVDLTRIIEVARDHGATVEFTMLAEAEQYRRTLALIAEEEAAAQSRASTNGESASTQ